VNVHFIEPMECFPVRALPTDANWTYEIKLNGYRSEAVLTPVRIVLDARRGKEMKVPEIAKALEHLSSGTIIDGELAAPDEDG
jgi:bifunctional non-homologous end joining protein LigD